ncbi:SoxR reducing system RseC family protein [Agarivorans aestuarii]|uniref:SoxR reducing system RseC family protein n=1 Tax=Agarivorans aestuarii TaxID=1563703 RepID=A0ABU7G424_9ALTE|nr:SoxR reducing system RseC family protein [Agarivorans aestuarii]MEE1673225.1 SoxR reducing system RseC family protein [Agarivorans aestuarii]
MAQITMQVISVDNDKVVLQGQRASACASCASKSTCLSVSEEHPALLKAELSSTSSYRLGQKVTLNCQDNFLLKAMLVLFMPALLGLVGFALLANNLFASSFQENIEHINLGASLCGFALGLLLSRHLVKPIIGQLNQQLTLKALTESNND